MVLRLLGAMLLLIVLAFAGFGFLATFEPGPGMMVWRIGYGIVFTLCVIGIGVILMKR